eukprot:scaffold26486_cov118-Isochrysis_galbana.AAC.2
MPVCTPWLDAPALPRIEVDSAPKTINLRRNRWQTYSVDADGIRKWTPVGEDLSSFLVREMRRGRGFGRPVQLLHPGPGAAGWRSRKWKKIRSAPHPRVLFRLRFVSALLQQRRPMC